MSTEPTPLVKPCDMPCEKCGSADIHRQYRRPGDVWARQQHEPFHLRARENRWRKPYQAFDWQAKVECITHCCRTCEWTWESDPLYSTKVPSAQIDSCPVALTPVPSKE